MLTSVFDGMLPSKIELHSSLGRHPARVKQAFSKLTLYKTVAEFEGEWARVTLTTARPLRRRRS